MASGTIPFGFKDITSAFTPTSGLSLQVLQIGNLLIARAVGNRVASTADWNICDIPEAYRPADQRWIGNAFLNNKGVAVCTMNAALDTIYISSPGGTTSMAWCSIELVWVLGSSSIV